MKIENIKVGEKYLYSWMRFLTPVVCTRVGAKTVSLDRLEPYRAVAALGSVAERARPEDVIPWSDTLLAEYRIVSDAYEEANSNFSKFIIKLRTEADTQ